QRLVRRVDVLTIQAAGECQRAMIRCPTRSACGAAAARCCRAAPRTRPGWTTTRSASTAPGTGTSPCRCSPTPSSPSPPPPPPPHRPRTPPRGRASPSGAAKKGTCPLWPAFCPPRTYPPPPFITGENDRDLIPLTAAEARRLFNLHVHVSRPPVFREQWSHWR